MSWSIKTKADAERRGRQVLSMMTGKGWKLRVHENLGWFFRLYRDDVNLTVSETSYGGKSRFACLLGEDRYPGSGCGIWHGYVNGTTYRDPNKAVAAYVANARAVVDRYVDIVVRAERVAGLGLPSTEVEVRARIDRTVRQAVKTLLSLTSKPSRRRRPAVATPKKGR